MIAHRIERAPSKSSSPAKLVKYMVAAKGQIEPTSWARTADYILDTAAETSKGEKVASFRVMNCGTDDPADAAILILATQSANTRSKAEKTYHLVYSFPPGERPSLDVLHSIEDELCEAIGFADHQRVSAVHIDTDHLHVHVAINKVHPTGLQNIEPYYDKKRLMEACERLEIKHDLQRTNHGLQKGKDHEQSRERERIELGPNQSPDGRTSLFRRYLRESYDLQITEPPEAKTFNDLRTLSGGRVARSPEGASVLLPGDAPIGLVGGSSRRAPGVRRPGDGDRADAGEPSGSGRVSGKPADVEAHSGVETLTGYVARDVAPAMRKATTWAELHEAVAAHGLELKQRGNGLVIGDPGLSLWAKASNCGRDLSAKALSDRLGPFEPGQARAEGEPRGRKSYAPKPRQENPASAALFAQYQRERQAATLARRQGFDQLKRENAAFKVELSNWQRRERMMLKVAAKGATRKIMQGTIKQQAEASRANNRKAMDERRNALFKQTSSPAWADWLAQQAEKGNTDALSVLRSKEEREQRWRGNLLSAGKGDRAKTIVLGALKPKARKDGTMAYSTVDGGMVIDRSTHVHAQKATTAAALVALELASKRFENQALIVEGTAEFRQEVAQLAGLHGLQVRFADPEMERMRQEAADQKGAAPKERFDKLAAHGAAPYENKPGAKKSYFATLEGPDGEQRTVWGVDLARAIKESGAKVGDHVQLDHIGAVPVTLPDGREVMRNSWHVEVEATDQPKANETERKSGKDLSAKHGQSRTTKAAQKGPKASAAGVKSAPPASVVDWVADRNKQRDKISSIDYHRLWTDKDAGAAIYQGRRSMKDGSEVLLLKRGDEVLVKPSSSRVVAKAAKWKVGRAVQLDARGRFVERSNEVEL